MKKQSITGGCLCGSVTYSIEGSLRQVVNCHCRSCRIVHGSYGAYTSTDINTIKYQEQSGLRWFLSTDTVEQQITRGFCKQCGASLFWLVKGSGRISIAAGSLEQPSDLHSISHIWVSDKADFYDITDRLPQHACGLPQD